MTSCIALAPKGKGFQFLWFWIEYHQIFYTSLKDKDVDDYKNSITSKANRGDLENEIFRPYTRDNTIFLLQALNPSILFYEDIKNNLAESEFRLFIYTSSKAEELNYRITELRIITAEYEKNVDELGFVWRKESNQAKETHDMRAMEQNTNYKKGVITAGEFKYPCPENMEFTMRLKIEATEAGQITEHIIDYNYTLKKVESGVGVVD
jgi:hypothetical protein